MSAKQEVVLEPRQEEFLQREATKREIAMEPLGKPSDAIIALVARLEQYSGLRLKVKFWPSKSGLRMYELYILDEQGDPVTRIGNTQYGPMAFYEMLLALTQFTQYFKEYFEEEVKLRHVSRTRRNNRSRTNAGESRFSGSSRDSVRYYRDVGYRISTLQIVDEISRNPFRSGF